MNMNRTAIRWFLLSALILSFSVASFAQLFISVRIGPPVLPVYAQPICPGPGYIWTPGYWAWNDDGGYYWVPGTWVVAPVGLLWTPGYWGWGGGLYVWHAGYWGPHVGFYGGINYGFGYTGVGFYGGEWRSGNFYYNRSVTNVSVTNVTNVYNKTVIVNNTTVNNVSYNGGTGGVTARPTPQEEAYAREPHTAPLAAQTQQEHLASQNRQNFASENHGRPAIAATARAGDFSSHSVVAARSAGGEYHAPAMSPKEARGPSRPMNANNGNRPNNEGFRPFTPPSKSGNPNPNGNNARPGGFRPADNNGGNQNRPSGGSNPPRSNQSQNQPRPQSNPHTAPPHQSAPPQQHQGPRNEGAPKEERHRE